MHEFANIALYFKVCSFLLSTEIKKKKDQGYPTSASALTLGLSSMKPGMTMAYLPWFHHTPSRHKILKMKSSLNCMSIQQKIYPYTRVLSCVRAHTFYSAH